MENEKKYKVLVVDDDSTNLLVINKTLSPKGFEVEGLTSPKEALKRVPELQPDVILLDVMMPEMNGFEVCRLLKSDKKTRLIPIVLITALQEKEDKITGIEAGCDDFLSKPIDRLELIARVTALSKVKRLNDELVHAESIVMSFARAVEAKDGNTGDHCDRLARMVTSFAQELGLKQADILTLARASILHDVGKIGVPDEILLKPGKLSPEEWNVMKRHPVIGEEICKPLAIFADVLPVIRHHHEKWNGSGYPDGLKGEDIPHLARVFQIIDAYDALTTKRPYKKPFSTEETLELLENETKNGLWDPKLMESFISFLKKNRGEFSVVDED
ncbi:MAG: two-component system response regulator [Deltaproteobacteria bacterium CG_4_10_14_0_2_um_filter_43_8]|nr:MAG: two-component system response regulator [Deltaproteobacteria bacterium CG11_big_fil_rev_8_21_14_0_20_42_23]PJA19588.1 MAG: two-component system response regulator [Deltaproteobacteria bacterium CG_4_10_14_0_2_um_filter_43_8]PJC63796.1 MAG: two-component system response regulator [Deltaproteobacteria bacterium CG_4_9_14_0_2_um_filter_42_21]